MLKLAPGQRFQLWLRVNLHGDAAIENLPPDGGPLLLGFLRVRSVLEESRSSKGNHDDDGDAGAATGNSNRSIEGAIAKVRASDADDYAVSGICDLLALVGSMKRSTTFSLNVSRLKFYGAPRKLVRRNSFENLTSPSTFSLSPQQSSFWVRNLSDARDLEIQVTSQIPPTLATVVDLTPQKSQLQPGQAIQINVLLIPRVHSKQFHESDETDEQMCIRVFDTKGARIDCSPIHIFCVTRYCDLSGLGR